MKVARTVTLELLRHGPAHNQLLSPELRYLAVLGADAAETVQVPWEHRTFLRRMQDLRYETTADRRRGALEEMAEDLGGIFRALPGFGHALFGGAAGREDLVHLELVLTAAELSLLPFESAQSPAGSPGEGRPLLLDAVAPVTLTRRVRAAGRRPAVWPSKARVLVVIAAPQGLSVPAVEHVAAIRKAVAPWVRARADEVMTVLPRATLRALEEECARRAYTHVHILAHGVASGDRFALAFHDDGDGRDLVDGERLATALHPHMASGDGALSDPAVVTIAACDGGNPGTVVEPGASLAHALHFAGVPFVVASQLPLTFEGSELLAKVLYERLLRGDDPRVALHELRQRLSLLGPDVLDWASVVAYAALPPDFEAQLRRAQVAQARRAAGATLARMDDAAAAGDGDDRTPELDDALQRLDRACPRGDDPESRALRAEICGQSGSIWKRRALARGRAEIDPARGPRGALLHDLTEARRRYREGLRADLASHWLATQYLSLVAVLDGKLAEDWLALATLSAHQDLNAAPAATRAWAHGTLLELELLRTLDPARRAQASLSASHHATALAELMGAHTFEILSTVRQLQRYEQWRWAAIAPICDAAAELTSLLTP